MSVTSTDLNLKHLSAVLEIHRAGGISQAAGLLNMSQPAITHGVKTLEEQIGTRLFDRGARGMSATPIGAKFIDRIGRALTRLNEKLPKTRAGKRAEHIQRRASTAQLRTLISVTETASFSAAARQLGAAQPTIYRAARDLEAVLNIDLFEKTTRGVLPTPAAERIS